MSGDTHLNVIGGFGRCETHGFQWFYNKPPLTCTICDHDEWLASKRAFLDRLKAPRGVGPPVPPKVNRPTPRG